MENRWSKRFPIAIKVLLYHHGIPVATCKTRDIGKAGIFVESGSLLYRVSTMLKVEFEIASPSRRQFYRLSAIVAHLSQDGLGLFFSDEQSKEFEVWCCEFKNRSTNILCDEPDASAVYVLG